MPRRRTTSVQPTIQLATLRQQVDLLRLEAGTRRKVLGLLDNLLVELQGRLVSSGDLTKFTKARLNALLAQTVDTIEGYYAKAQAASEKALTAAAEVQASATAKTLERAFVAIDLSASLPTETFLARAVSNTLVMGAPSEDWWARQARDTAFKFANAVRQGLTAGDTTEQVAARVAGRSGYPGIMDVSRANARSLVHTSIQEVSAEARRETYKQNDDIIEGTRQVSTLDSNTTDICMAYDGAEYDLEGEPINGTELPYEGGVPRHWGCRSVEVPITKTFKELGVNIPEPVGGARASEDGPVPASMTFADFLDAHTKDEQDEMLGAGRAELWRNGDITLQQLLDQKGNPLSLAELRDKYVD